MPSPRLTKRMKQSAIGLIFLAILVGGVYLGALCWHWHTFPYGQSHRCLKQLGLALL